MIPRLKTGDVLWPHDVHAVERALGLPESPAGRRIAEVWDDIAHTVGAPDTEQLKHGMDGPSDETLPPWAWNMAVDAANRAAGFSRSR